MIFFEVKLYEWYGDIMLVVVMFDKRFFGFFDVLMWKE